MKVLDLFCGMGGLSLGFTQTNYDVCGIDIDKMAGLTYEYNKVGKFILKDLSKEYHIENVDIITGGSPCQPFSTLNQKKRGKEHEAYNLLEIYFKHILEIKPKYFVFENVPAVNKDKTLQTYIEILKQNGYYLFNKFIYYSDYGTALKRKRYFLFGSKKEKDLEYINKELENRKKEPLKLKDVISQYLDLKENEFPDHQWSKRDIKKIEKRIKESSWKDRRKLCMDDYCPSISGKVEFIHPIHERILSVRELMEIFGFPKTFVFPKEVSLTRKYKMLANAVSPVFSKVVAEIIKDLS